MKYILMRCYLKKNGYQFMELVFDLWNYEYETGYEIKVTLHNMSAWVIEPYADNICDSIIVIRANINCIQDIPLNKKEGAEKE